MSVTVEIPTPLRRFTDGEAAVEVEGGTVGQALRSLTGRYPELARHLYAGDGKLRSFVNVFVNDQDSRHLDGEATVVRSGDSLLIIPSIAGGAARAAGGGR